jgi:hypothetical protein
MANLIAAAVFETKERRFAREAFERGQLWAYPHSEFLPDEWKRPIAPQHRSLRMPERCERPGPRTLLFGPQTQATPK